MIAVAIAGKTGDPQKIRLLLRRYDRARADFLYVLSGNGLLFSRVFGMIFPMLKIRLQRTGRKNDPSFRIVVVEGTEGPRTGNHIDLVGFYNAATKEKRADGDKAKQWIAKGAQPSDTVFNLLISEGVLEGKKRNALPKKTPIVKEVSKDATPKTPESVETPAETVSPTESVAEVASTDESPKVEEAPTAEAPETAPASEAEATAPEEAKEQTV